MAMSTSLTTVVSQMNNMREQTGDAVIDVNDLQPDDADEVFYYIDDALNQSGYVKGSSASVTPSSIGFGTTNNAEDQTMYLSAVVDLLQSGYDTPQYVVNF